MCYSLTGSLEVSLYNTVLISGLCRKKEHGKSGASMLLVIWLSCHQVTEASYIQFIQDYLVVGLYMLRLDEDF